MYDLRRLAEEIKSQLSSFRVGLWIYRLLLNGVLISAIFLGIFYVAAWLAPHVVSTYETAQAGVTKGVSDPGQSGLIYVESPEVYTRQRLVNDRYLQDAWLNERLREIDDPNSSWIEEVRADSMSTALRLVARRAELNSDAPESESENRPENAALDEAYLDLLLQIPFEARFKLQSQARDNIRQLILENSLDDRHDLSGNTVFGLKFDTSIIPASNTRRSPTVIVRMAPTQLDRLLNRDKKHEIPRSPDEFVAHFLRISGGGQNELTADERQTLQKIDENFQDWVHNVEQRLEAYRRAANRSEANNFSKQSRQSVPKGYGSFDDEGSTAGVSCAAALSTPLCDGKMVSDDAIKVLNEELRGASILDRSLEYVTRFSEGSSIGSSLRRQTLISADAACKKPENYENPKTVRDLLDFRAVQSKTQSIPGAWGLFFQANGVFSPRNELESGEELKSGQCLDFNLSLEEADIELTLYRSDAPASNASPIAKLYKMPCQLCDSRENAFKVGISPQDSKRIGATELNSILPDETLLQIWSAAGEGQNAPGRCLAYPAVEGQGGSPIADKTQEPFSVLDNEQDRTNAREFGLVVVDGTCVQAQELQFRVGAYEFFRRMTEVESYTYAAFPRGDVAGVVTEADRRSVLDLGVGTSDAQGRFGLSTGSRSREIIAVPTVINFASGQSRYVGSSRYDSDTSSSDDEANRNQTADPELFDFGWTIVKEGVKDPMMASQLVLVSVPAYLDEIRLTIWKGFLDPDLIPTDRKSFNQLDLDGRVAKLLSGAEKREISLNVPPDFAALDSIVIGRNEIFGPLINDLDLECVSPSVDGRVNVVIPGERLWRSTVVTLAGERASRIEVMPDMRGIRATFDLRCTGDTCGEENTQTTIDRFIEEIETRNPKLRVWTSEGNTSAVATVCDNAK